MRLQPLSPIDTEGPTPHSFSPKIGREEEEGGRNEEEERKWVLEVRMRCFPYECKAFRGTDRIYSLEEEQDSMGSGREEKNKR